MSDKKKRWRVTTFKIEKIWDFEMVAKNKLAAELKAREAIRNGARPSEKGEREYFTTTQELPEKEVEQ